MLTPKPQLNLRNAKSYFREHLAVGDYYTEGHAVAGQWRGLGASMLGLEGAVTEEEFLRLCDGLHPKTGEWLTVRRKTTRRVTRHVSQRGDSQGKEVAQDEDAARAGEKEGLVSNRRVFYDFTISPPKSVSVIALYQDARIIAVHDEAARVMLDELEKFAETRVRRGGANTERETGKFVGALFRHDTSRELDPHLHTHCILFNATYDQVEERWKALHATGMYRAQKFAENLYYHELAKGLRELGYEIENNARDFEIKGVPADVISRFSKRHHQIDEETQRRIEAERVVEAERTKEAAGKGAVGKGAVGNSANGNGADGDGLDNHASSSTGNARSAKSIKNLREQVAHDKRRRKIKNTPTEHLRPHWELQMSAEERRALASLTPQDATLSPADATAPGAAVKPSSFVAKLSSLVAKLWPSAAATNADEKPPAGSPPAPADERSEQSVVATASSTAATPPPSAAASSVAAPPAAAVPLSATEQPAPAGVSPSPVGATATAANALPTPFHTPTHAPAHAPAMPVKSGVPDFLEWAQRHTFERQAVTTDHALLALALARGRGENFTIEELRAEFEASVKSERYFRDRRSPDVRTAHKITSRETLRREWNIIFAAQDGRNRHAPFCPPLPQSALPPSLSAEKRHAVESILRSRDFITLFQGGAGTGKSFTLREVVRGLKAHGHPVVVAAPQNQQAADLQRDGLEGASTLARLLAANAPATPTGQATHAEPHARSTQKLPPGAVVILDEAGQVGASDMLALVHAVQACHGRLILSGDTRQHGAVAAGDALRIIEELTDLRPARLKTIHRQDPDKVSSEEEKRFVRQYRKAVEAASDGRLSDSFNTLDAMGCVRELTPEARCETLAREYCAALERGEKVLVVAPTWAEVREANAAIRERLGATGKLIKSAFGEQLTSWQSIDLSEAQKQDARFYPPDVKVVFVRNYGRFAKGDACEIAGFSEHGVRLRKVDSTADSKANFNADSTSDSRCNSGLETTVSFQHASRFIVAKPHEIKVARGERLQMKFNGQSVEGTPIRNGELVTVRRVLADGRIVVRDDAGVRKTLKPEQRLFVPGYAVTSYSSQGKTVDTVLVSYANADAGVDAAADGRTSASEGGGMRAGAGANMSGGKPASALPVNRNQWYVAISRARKKVLVLTDDKEALRVRVEQESRRESALSLVPDLVAKLPAPAAAGTMKKEEIEAVKPVEENASSRGLEASPNLQPGVEPDEPSEPAQTRTPSSVASNIPLTSSGNSRPQHNTCPPFPRAVQADVERGVQTQRQAMLEPFFQLPKHSATARASAALAPPQPFEPAPDGQPRTLLEELERMNAMPVSAPEAGFAIDSAPAPDGQQHTLLETLERMNAMPVPTPAAEIAANSAPASDGQPRPLLEELERMNAMPAPAPAAEAAADFAPTLDGQWRTLLEELEHMNAMPISTPAAGAAADSALLSEPWPLTLREQLEQPLPPIASEPTPTTGQWRSLLEVLEQTPLPSTSAPSASPSTAPVSSAQSTGYDADPMPSLAERLRQLNELDAQPETNISPSRQVARPGEKTNANPDIGPTTKPNREHL